MKVLSYYDIDKIEQFLIEKNYVRIKEYIVALYNITDSCLTTVKKNNIYTRDVAREVLQYKNKISNLLSIQYDGIIDLNTNIVMQC